MDIRNLTKERVDTKNLRALSKKVLNKEGKRGSNLSLVFVGGKTMRKLNKKYRGKDKATNVLAFPGGEDALGEIVLCPSVIAKDAVKYKISRRKALSWMFAHGLLHLLGHEHKTKKGEREMTRKEQEYLS